MSKEKSLYEKIRNIDPRITYTLLLIAVVIPLYMPFGFPIAVTKMSKDFHDTVDGLKPGDLVFYGVDGSAHGYPECAPGYTVIINHVLAKGGKLVMWSRHQDGSLLYQKIIPSLKLSGKTYGVDYVYLGYIPGDEGALAALASDIKGTAKVDYFGTSTSNIPILKNVNSVADFKMAITGGAESFIIDAYVRQIKARFNVPLGVAAGAVQFPEKIVYYPTQIFGILNGATGAAEYEQLRKEPGLATGRMDTMTTTQYLLLALVILANIAFLAQKSKRR